MGSEEEKEIQLNLFYNFENENNRITKSQNHKSSEKSGRKATLFGVIFEERTIYL